MPERKDNAALLARLRAAGFSPTAPSRWHAGDALHRGLMLGVTNAAIDRLDGDVARMLALIDVEG